MSSRLLTCPPDFSCPPAHSLVVMIHATSPGDPLMDTYYGWIGAPVVARLQPVQPCCLCNCSMWGCVSAEGSRVRVAEPTLVVAAQSKSGQAQLRCTTFPAASRPTRTRLCVLGEQQPAIRDSTAPISPRWLQLSSVLLQRSCTNAGTSRTFPLNEEVDQERHAAADTASGPTHAERSA